MFDLEEITEKTLRGGQVTRAEALALYRQPLDELCRAANRIRMCFCADRFDICTIINGKSGKLFRELQILRPGALLRLRT
jgi:biotin synthase